MTEAIKNPSKNRGRPKGSRNQRTLLLEAMMESDGKAVVQAVVKKAKEGDMQAAKLVLERLAPAPRSRAIKMKLPDISDAEGVANAFAETLRAVAKGQIAPDEAQTVATILEGKRRSIELSELDTRVRALEAGRR